MVFSVTPRAKQPEQSLSAETQQERLPRAALGYFDQMFQRAQPLSLEAEIALTSAIRERQCEMERLLLGQPIVVADLLARVQRRLDSDSPFAPLLRENNAVAMLQGALSRLHNALKNYKRGAIDPTRLGTILEQEGEQVARHRILWRASILNSPQLEIYRKQLLARRQPLSSPQYETSGTGKGMVDYMPPSLHDQVVQRVERIHAELIGLYEQIVNSNLRLIKLVATRFDVPKDQKEDLLSAGYEGLLAAARTFKPEYGFKFSTYAYRAIQARMGKCITRRRAGPPMILMGGAADADLRDWLESSIPDRAGGSTAAESQRPAQAVELRTLLREAIAALPEDERRAVKEFYGFERGRGGDTTAEAEGKPTPTVARAPLLVRARRNLRRLLEERGAEELAKFEILREPAARSEGAPREHEQPPSPVGLAVAEISPALSPILMPRQARVDARSDNRATMESGGRASDPALGALVLQLRGRLALLGSRSQLAAGPELFEATERYCQELARLRRLTSDTPATEDEARSCVELISEVHTALKTRWPREHMSRTYGFVLEGEMLAIRPSLSVTHLRQALAATDEYLMSLHRK